MKEENCLKDLWIDRIIMLKCSLKKENLTVRTGFTWLRFGTSGDEHGI